MAVTRPIGSGALGVARVVKQSERGPRAVGCGRRWAGGSPQAQEVLTRGRRCHERSWSWNRRRRAMENIRSVRGRRSAALRAGLAVELRWPRAVAAVSSRGRSGAACWKRASGSRATEEEARELVWLWVKLQRRRLSHARGCGHDGGWWRRAELRRVDGGGRELWRRS